MTDNSWVDSGDLDPNLYEIYRQPPQAPPNFFNRMLQLARRLTHSDK